MARTIQKVLRKNISTWGGSNTVLKDLESIPDGVSPDSLNWITSDLKDSISLRRGTLPLGTATNESGKITGIGTGRRFDGVEIPFFTHGRKAFYYDADTDDRVEIGSDLLPENASGLDVFIKPYQNLAGSFVYLSSPEFGTYKIPTANPGSAVYQNATDFQGYISFHQSRSFLIQKNTVGGQRNYSTLFLSYIDKYLASDYTEVSNEDVGNGDGSTKNFSGTLAQATAPRTVFYVSIAGATSAGLSVSGITKATSAVVTVVGHSFSVGDPIMITGVSGMTEINGLIGYVSTIPSATQVTITIDSSGFSAYSSGGTIYKCEVFQDNRDGVLSSKEGGTGTINYATGAFDVTFFSAPQNLTDIIANYYWENATSEGVLDFSTKFTGSVRDPGTGDAMLQFGGSGDLNVAVPLSNIFFCFHEANTWQVSIPTDDSATGRSNLPYRDRMGAPSIRSAFPGAKGIYFVDYHDKNSKPEIRKLEIYTGGSSATNTVIPTLISKVLDLSSCSFDEAVVYEWGRYVLVACKQIRNGVADGFNTRVYLYNILTKAWDILGYPVACLSEYLGTLICGDPLTNDIYTLFSGFDDNGSDIVNYWTSKLDNVGWKGQKRVRRMIIDGLIQPKQKVRVSLAFDGGAFVPYFLIDGSGPYVNTAASIAVGTQTIGATVGGGGATVFASPFWVEFPVNTPVFQYIRVKFEANAKTDPNETVGGYIQLNSYEFYDIRLKSNKSAAVRIVGS